MVPLFELTDRPRSGLVRLLFAARGRNWALMLLMLLSGLTVNLAQPALAGLERTESGITYTNDRVARIPWSIHVVQIPRSSMFEIHSAHADNRALGLSTLTDQIQGMNPALGRPVAAVNGDYYQRNREYAGDPRGLQIVDGEVISAPVGSVCFWIDVFGQPHATNVQSRFEVIWPDGTTNSIGLNEDRWREGLVLYTPAVGASTLTEGGRELILEKAGDPWLPLRMGRTLKARVREIREAGNSRLDNNTLVLSLEPAFARTSPRLEVGSQLTISTASLPDLRGAKTAIGGGPVLVREGKRERIQRPEGGSYEFNSMMRRHPRAAVGWNSDKFFLVEVDGRQWNLSIGMTLDELANYLITLGCDGAMNLDGGGSATLWYEGQIRNSPSEGDERLVANSLVVVRKRPASQGSEPSQNPPGR
jgi:hypothetical protein